MIYYHVEVILEMKNQVRDSKSLGDRMKEYERAYDFKFSKRMPLILRLDGRAFHTFTKKFKRPYDETFISLMDKIARYLCENIQGAKIAYVQSDEITILIKYYDELNSEPWFGNEMQKILSSSAALASSYFTSLICLGKALGIKEFSDISWAPVQFDCKAFILPEDEVCNNFIFRQQDWERNSVQLLGQILFSQKELQGKSCKEIIRMCKDKGTSWSSLPTKLKRGRCIVRKPDTVEVLRSKGKLRLTNWAVDDEIPIFKDNRDYINQYLGLK